MKKKAIFIASAKGGVGKSTVAKALLEYLRNQKKKDGTAVRVHAYDTDPNVGQLALAYGLKDKEGEYDVIENNNRPDAGVLMFDAKSDADKFGDTLDTDADIVLMDLPGGLIDLSYVYGDMKSFKDQYRQEGYEIVVLCVITQVQASGASVTKVMDIWGDDVTYVVAKNQSFGNDEDFYFFDGELATQFGNPAAKVLAAGGKIISFPALDHGTFALVDKWLVTFSQAIPRLLSQRGILTGWRIRLTKIEGFLKQTETCFSSLELIN
ncbi:hypothetical protein [Rhodoferax aquaticus]|uniref:CobQ/CobB/MinD/ParA nucleotide binding domain-containing protein n=1 Tax=Rhodoferax aquaticus TaxID=2527691 RepID=A0A515EQR4_9BURK|nr:hypothetical protein [Rhodoferax aquaticus]QDL55002.1 hypothetical protein EXZ61_12970 [Rhodoferax aquaticus]